MKIVASAALLPAGIKESFGRDISNWDMVIKEYHFPKTPKYLRCNFLCRSFMEKKGFLTGKIMFNPPRINYRRKMEFYRRKLFLHYT